MSQFVRCSGNIFYGHLLLLFLCYCITKVWVITSLKVCKATVFISYQPPKWGNIKLIFKFWSSFVKQIVGDVHFSLSLNLSNTITLYIFLKRVTEKKKDISCYYTTTPYVSKCHALEFTQRAVTLWFQL